jgi:3-oxoacyl-[acyl-carrier-protein] synthase-3
LYKALPNAAIISTGSYLPAKILTNKALEKMVDTSDEWIRTRTGIMERRIADTREASAEMGIKAAKLAIEDAGLKAEAIDLIITATITSDYQFPSTACLIQKKLGAKNAACFDLAAACPGFIYALASGAQFIRTGEYRCILIVITDTLSRITDWKDRNTCVLFGDGAAACIIAAGKKDTGLISFLLGADGTGSELLMLPAGGSRLPASEDTVRQRLHYLKMNGNEVFKFAVRIMEKTALDILKKNNLDIEDITWFIPHQANMRIIESVSKRLDIPMEKVVINVNKYGNVSAVSIPLAIDEMRREGKIKKGDLMLLDAFGSGMTWGACLIRW